MKFLLSMSLIVSVFIYADDHNDEKPMYEANVAEYYFSTFKDGKDMDDMMRWAEKWEKWATTGDAADANADYRASMLIPYYGESLDQLDFVWLGINTNPLWRPPPQILLSSYSILNRDLSKAFLAASSSFSIAVSINSY